MRTLEQIANDFKSRHTQDEINAYVESGDYTELYEMLDEYCVNLMNYDDFRNEYLQMVLELL